MDEKIEITLPTKLLQRIDEIRELLGYRTRGEFITAAIRRLLDQYTILTSELHQQREQDHLMYPKENIK